MTIVDLANPGGAALQKLGGKAAGLAKLIAAGLPVPPALVLTPDDGLSDDLPLIIEQRLGRGTYFVRSSFDIEDAASQSFAGQGLTIGHLDRRDVPAAIMRVWDSWYAPQAQAYRQHLTLTGQRSGSVVIQREIAPIWSGVLFTRSPGAIGAWARIEAAKGYGEAVVRGQTTPVAIEFHRRRRRSLDPIADRDLAAIVEKLRRLIPSLEKAVGGIGDIEWCVDAQQKLWILQARSATDATAKTQYWSSTLSDEFWSGHVSKLMFSTVGRAIEQTMLREPLSVFPEPLPASLLRVYAGRIYVDVGSLARALPVIPPWAVTDRILQMFPTAIHLRYRRERAAHAPWLPQELLSVGVRFIRQGFPWLPLQQPRRLKRVLARATAWQQAPVPAVGAMGTEVEAILGDLATSLRDVVWGVMYAYLFAPFMDWLLGKHATSPEAACLYKRLPHDPVHQLDAELVDFARRFPDAVKLSDWHTVATDDRLAAAKSAYLALLLRWGHRAEERDLAGRRWQERPELLWQLAVLAGKRSDSSAASWRMWLATRVAPWYKPWLWPRLGLLLAIGSLTRIYVGYRERMRDIADRYLLALRQRFVVLSGGDPNVWGRGWKDGMLADDIAMYDGKRPGQQTWPAFLANDTPIDQGAAPIEVDLQGIAVSPGIGVGKAVWIRSIDDLAKFRPGDVLLAEYLDPSFSLVLESSAAAAFVAGGMLSHGAIIAREYRIPAVVGVAGLRRIADGVTLRIDGHHGRVEPVDG